ncbi:hypothetical protein GCM10010358_83880 [Streptomyces minutiscleroticus]|uniref:STAS domain-containing protein n=1 Tax=Streptomyces minutiscleroticus TaxID=68238 RepID=A0A918P5K6_9ACTN|nr:hypothetical protein [Streptomyces minutiscleroticus]GGY22000.1 hypothetical protein GCM10010358_83880 [Streptomyces minutiscleroticus]
MMPGAGFELVICGATAGDGAVWVGAIGEVRLDEVQLLAEAIGQVVRGEDDTHRVVLDLSEVSYCSHDASFTLWGMCAGFHAAGIGVALAEVSSMARIAFEGTHLDKRFSFLER